MAKIDRTKLLEYLDNEVGEQLNLAALIRYCLVEDSNFDLTQIEIFTK
jgi:hypothetical protein